MNLVTAFLRNDLDQTCATVHAACGDAGVRILLAAVGGPRPAYAARPAAAPSAANPLIDELTDLMAR